jgi:hypothetical protein
VELDQRYDARMDVDQAALQGDPGRGLDHSAVERDQAPRAGRGHHAVARAGGAGIDAENPHGA